MRKNFEVVGSFGSERVKNINAERTINMFEFIDVRGKKPKTLFPTSGMQEAVDLLIDEGGFRAGIVFKNVAYVVVYDQVIAIDDLLVPTNIGTLGTTSGYVGVAANVNQVIFVDGTEGWVYDTIASTFTQIVAAGFPTNPIDVTFLDGFFIVPFGDTPEFGISGLNDGMAWDALDFALITTHPGTITAVKTLHRRLFIFSQNYTEVWENAGLSDFPFRRNNSLLIELGTPSVASVTAGFDKMFFLSQDADGLGSVMMVTGTQAIPVSNQALDYELQKYATVADASAILYRDNGIIFYRLNFTDADKTWVYNVSMSQPGAHLWHEEQMLDGSRHLAQIHIYFQEKSYFGSYLDGILYEVDDSFLTNNGESIKRLRITRPTTDESYKKIRVDRIEIDLMQGFASSNGDDKDPEVLLFISRDGGNTFGNGIRASMGKIGNRTARTIWRKLGTARDFVCRFEFYNQVKFVVLGGAVSFETLPE